MTSIKARAVCFWIIVACGMALGFSGRTAELSWAGSRAEAVTAARNSAKLVLMLAGRDSCGNCMYMKGLCESSTARPVIDANYICWDCPYDESTEWRVYATDLGSITLPLICVIDPGDPLKYLDRSTSIQAESTFRKRLLDHLPTQEIVSTIGFQQTPRLVWGSESTLYYRVLRSTDFATWSFVGALVPGTGSPVAIEDASSGSECFYRVMGFK